MHLSIILTISLFLIFSVSVFAQGEIKASESRIADASGGYSFVVPKGWKNNNGNGGFVLLNAAGNTFIIVKAHTYNDFYSLVSDTNLQADGFQMIGQPRDLGNGVIYARAAKNTWQGILILDGLVLFSPNGGGVAIMSFSDRSNAETNLTAAKEIAGSILFTKPQETTEAKQWNTFLRGKRLIYLYTNNGYSRRIEIRLCSSGTFYISENESSLSGLGPGGMNSSNSGTWRVASAGDLELILQFQDGSANRYAISQRPVADEISLGGKRYFVKADGDCR